ncbi:MAG: hypothetical protein ACE5L6_01965 [Candidatus Bathyarchaeia archaeon]
MADWKTLYERWEELSEETKRKIFDTFLKKTPRQLKPLFLREPYAKLIWQKIPEAERFPEEKPAEAPEGPKFTKGQRVIHTTEPDLIFEVEKISREDGRITYEINTPDKTKHRAHVREEELQGIVEAEEKRWQPGDTAVYKWTGKTYEVVSSAKWPYILLKDEYGRMDTKNADQLVTPEEYEELKAEEMARRKKKPPKKKPKVVEVERPREKVLRDIFYATLTKEGVPIRTGYRSMWRLELPKILELPTAEEQETRAKDFAMHIVNLYRSEKEIRRKRRVIRARKPQVRPREEVPTYMPPVLPPGWIPVEGGYLVNGKFISEEEAPKFVEAEEVPAPEVPVLTGFVRRRCPHEDHDSEEWKQAHPEVEEQYPDGVFMANLTEERAAHALPCPAYFRNRRFLKFCPYHRHTEFGVYVTTLANWIRVYMWMFKVSGGRQGLDPGVVKAAGLNPADYDKPLTWRPPGAVFEYWKQIGWAVPERIEKAWKETEKEYEEYERIWEKEKRREGEG